MFLLADLGNSKSKPRFLADLNLLTSSSKSRSFSEFCRYFVEQAAAFPAFIGTSWFQWVDQPCTGRSDGENYNIGLVDVTDRPYPALIEAMRVTHRRLQGVHAGTTPPYDAKPRPQ